MTEIMTWNYAGEADITYGEVHVSPVAKILLAISLIFIVVSVVSAIIFKDNIYDIMVNPKIVLRDQITLSDANGKKIDVTITPSNGNYFVDIPHNCSDFNPEALISEKDKKDYSIVKTDSNVDSSEIDTYRVKYISKNSVLTNTTILTVNVKDMTPPKITFKPNSSLLVRGVENNETTFGTESFKTADDFNNYLINVSDDSDIIDITNTGESVDFGSKGDGYKSVEVVYTAKDKYGNVGTASLTIMIVDDYEAAQNELNNAQKELNQIKANSSIGNSSSGNKPNTDASGTASLSADPITWSVSQDGPFTSLTMSTKGIHYAGNGQAQPIGGVGRDFQPEGPGVYERTWACSEGLTVTQQVTIVE